MDHTVGAFDVGLHDRGFLVDQDSSVLGHGDRDGGAVDRLDLGTVERDDGLRGRLERNDVVGEDRGQRLGVGEELFGVEKLEWMIGCSTPSSRELVQSTRYSPSGRPTISKCCSVKSRRGPNSSSPAQ